MQQAQEKNAVETTEVKTADVKPEQPGLEQLDEDLLRQISGAGSSDPTSLPNGGW